MVARLNPAKFADLRERLANLVVNHAIDAAAVLATIANDEKIPPSVRAQAASALLGQGVRLVAGPSVQVNTQVVNQANRRLTDVEVIDLAEKHGVPLPPHLAMLKASLHAGNLPPVIRVGQAPT